MYKIRSWVMAVTILGSNVALAQDIVGLEDCTKTTGLDRRTSCFQSNIEYLYKIIRKNAADEQQNRNAASSEINALKTDMASLRTSIEQVQNAAKKPAEK